MLSALGASSRRLQALRASPKPASPSSAPFKSVNSIIRYSVAAHLIRPITPLNRAGLSILPSNRISYPSLIRQPSTSSRQYSSEAQESKDTDAQVELRSHLKSFLMRVHPDFFSKHPKIQEENDRSLKQLNSLLDMAEEYSKKAAGPILLDRTRVPARYSATFYLRSGPKTLAETKAAEKKKEADAKNEKDPNLFPPAPGSEFPMIVSTYTIPESYFSNPFSREQLERDVRLFLNDLLKQAGLPMLDIAKSGNEGRYNADSEVIADQFENDGTYKPRETTDHRREAQALRKEFKNVLAAFLDRHFPAAQMAIEKLGHDWELHVGHKPEALIALGIADLHHSTDRERKQIHYQPDLDGEERAQGLLLVEELWTTGIIPTDIPIYITRDENQFLKPDALPGFITVPLSFENDTFQKYLKENLRTIMVTRYNLRGQLHEAEYLIRQFTKFFKLAHIETKSSLEHTVVALSAINEAKEHLANHHKADLEGMSWKIVEAELISQMTATGDIGSYVRPESSKSKRAPSTAPKTAEKGQKTRVDSSNPDTADTVENASSKVESTSKVEKNWTPESQGSGYELEEVEESSIKRRKLNLSPEYLAKMASIRAQKMEAAKQKAFSDDWDDDDEVEDVVASTTAAVESEKSEADIFKDIEKEWKKSKKDGIKLENLEKESDVMNGAAPDEFEEAIFEAQREQAEKINRELVYTEGTPVYSLKKDLLLIPWNTTSESIIAWFEANRAMLHFRQKMYPSKEWRAKLRMVCKNIKFLLGVSSVSFYGRTIWDKSAQIVALKNLETNAAMIRAANLHTFKLIVTQRSIGINFPKKSLKVPFNITPKVWNAFLRDLAAESKKPRVAGGKRFIGKTIHL